MTTADITLANGHQQNNIKHEFLMKELVNLYLLKLSVIREMLIGMGNDDILIKTENQLNG